MNIWSLVLLAAALLLPGCSDWETNPRGARAERAEAATGDIVVGVVWPSSGPKSGLWEGVEVAANEINAAGGVLGRKLRIVKADDGHSLAQGRLVAQEFADNRDMVAVIGHLHSYIALPASSIYQNAGLLYITPGATAHKLNAQGYDLVFRSIASSRAQGIQLAEYMTAQGHRRVAILYEKATETQNLANHFEQRARELGVTIVDRRGYLQGSQDFRVQINAWKDLYAFDAIFLGAGLEDGSTFITQARQLGLMLPIVAGEGLETRSLLVNKDAEGVVVPEQIAAAAMLDVPYRRFVTLHQGAHKSLPGTHAVLGYDAVHLLAASMRKANTTVPEKVAAALHGTTGWRGATGSFSFDATGDIPDKKIGFKKVQRGAFVELTCGSDGRCAPGEAGQVPPPVRAP